MGYCHCAYCRAWSAGPVNAFSIWPPEAVRITKGAENVGSYQKTERSVRKWCTACGGHLLSEHPTWGVTDVAAAVLPDLPFKAALHVNYGRRCCRCGTGCRSRRTSRRRWAGPGYCCRSDPRRRGGPCRLPHPVYKGSHF